MFPDRRKHPRFTAKDGLYAVSEPRSELHGQIVNISRGGLSFRYMDCADRYNAYPRIALFAANNRFRLEQIPVKIISDLEEAPVSPFGSIAMRRRHLQIGSLTPLQKIYLDYFLAHLTRHKPHHGLFETGVTPAQDLQLDMQRVLSSSGIDLRK